MIDIVLKGGKVKFDPSCNFVSDVHSLIYDEKLTSNGV